MKKYMYNYKMLKSYLTVPDIFVFQMAYVARDQSIGLDMGGYSVNIFLISPKNICCGYSLEAPRRGASNEYQQCMFSWRNKKNINTFVLKKAT